MKTLITLSLGLLLCSSFQTFASDDRHQAKLKKTGITAAFNHQIWSNRGQELKVKFVKIQPSQTSFHNQPVQLGLSIAESKVKKSRVPVAPFIFGDPDESIDLQALNIIAVNADVPTAPFNLGNPSDSPDL